MFRLFLTVIVVLIVGYSVATGNTILSIIAIIGGIFPISLVKRRLDEVVEDERINRVSWKASRKTLEIFGVSIALISFLLISYGYTDIGYVLAFSVCTLTILYLIFYAIYSKGEI